MKAFNSILANTLVASVSNNFLWFALTFWMYLETRSVIANAFIGAMFPIFTALFGVVFGTYVDHHKKKTSLRLSSLLSLALFSLSGLIYVIAPERSLLTFDSPYFWLFIVTVMSGAMAGSLRTIALSTIVTLLVPETHRDKANGRIGMVNGLSFAVTSVFSGLAIATIGMGWSLAVTIAVTVAALIHLETITFRDITHKLPDGETAKKIDFQGALSAIKSVPGLSALIFFSLINNFLAGVFFALMDPYGLELVSVEVWGLMWGVLSLSFMLGGILVSSKGLGSRPLRRLFQANLVMWLVSGLFPIRQSIIAAAIGMFFYMVFIPVVEAAEQTVLQKVVPAGKQGRVFGFASMAENLASPITALAMGPLAQGVFIPWMSTGGGAKAIGSWFGTGINRGIAVIFITASLCGFIVTLLAFRSRSYQRLAHAFAVSSIKT